MTSVEVLEQISIVTPLAVRFRDEATLGFICRQLGLNPAGYVKLVKASIERLATSKVLWRIKDAEG